MVRRLRTSRTGVLGGIARGMATRRGATLLRGGTSHSVAQYSVGETAQEWREQNRQFLLPYLTERVWPGRRATRARGT